MELSAKTAQLAMVGGESIGRAPNAGVFEYKSPWGTGRLYVFAESRGPSSEYLCRLAVETIGSEFKASNRSLTASLKSAMMAANRVLVAENQQSLRDHRATVGLTCAVARENEVFFAQAGPTVAYALIGGQITRIPAASSRSLPSWSSPLGSGEYPEISLARYEVGPKDVLLMASSLLATTPVESDLPALLALGPEDLLLQLEHLLHREAAFSALAVGFEAPHKQWKRTSLPAAGSPTPKRSSPPPAGKGRIPRSGPSLPAAILGVIGAIIGATYAQLKQVVAQRKKAGDALRVFLPEDGDGHNAPKPICHGNGKHSTKARSAGRKGSKQAVATKAAEEDALMMVWSSKKGTAAEKIKVPAPQAAPSRARNLRLPLFILMMALIPILACSFVVFFGRFSDKQSEDRFNRTMDSARVTRERALKAGDLAESRGLLNDADQLVSEALSLKKTDGKAKALKLAIDNDIAKLNAVVKLPDSKVLTDLAKVEGGAKNITNLVVVGEDAFILDRGSSRVYQFGIDLANGTLKVGKSTLIAKKGDKVGETTINDLVNILWMAGGTGRPTSNLLLFDSARNLFEYTPGKAMGTLKVRGSQSWLNPALALGYNSNLYILDPSASQVWRYFPTFNGYDSEMWGLLENADIKDAIDFAIDGNIFVLTRGGKLVKFVGGRPQTFNQDQLDKGLSNPTSLFIAPKSKQLYVVDAGNHRILVFSTEGKFQRQLVGEALEESPRSLYVDEERGKIYILSDQKLYLSALPK